MKKDWSHLDKFRQQEAPYLSPERSTFGSFLIPRQGTHLRVIACDASDPNYPWEHVSCHAYDPFFRKQRTPNWDEMCYLKSLFWDDTECVVQFHPATTDHICIHDHVLHLWKPINETIPMPPKICV